MNASESLTFEERKKARDNHCYHMDMEHIFEDFFFKDFTFLRFVFWPRSNRTAMIMFTHDPKYTKTELTRLDLFSRASLWLPHC